MRRTKRKYTITQAVKDKKPKVAFTGYSNLGGLKVPSVVLNKFKKGSARQWCLPNKLDKLIGLYHKLNMDAF